MTLIAGATISGLGSARALLVSAAAMAAVGLADDVLSLKASTKLVAHILIASVLLFFGFRLNWLESMIGDAMLTLFFAVYLARVRVYDDADFAMLKGESVTPLVANFMYKRRVAEVLLDLLLIPLAYYTAYRLRFEGAQFGQNYHLFIESLPVVLACQLLALFVVGGYRGTWQYFGMMDAVVFGKGVLFGTVASELAILYLYRFENYSRSVFVIDAAVLLLLLAGTRASFRLLGEFVLRRTAGGQRCIIYGTKGASLATIREAFGTGPLKVLGYVDDDPMQRNVRVGGYSVLGTYRDLLALARRGALDCVVLNTPLVDIARLRELEAVCRERDIHILRLQVQLKRISAAS